METSLHRQLKAVYAGEDAQLEVKLGRYRIDVVRNGELIEIQHGSLSGIRDKVSQLLTQHRVRVVKPLVARKCLVNCAGRNRLESGRRMSPKRACLLDLFDELIYFTRIYPHPNLALEVPLIEIEEWRCPRTPARRRHGRAHVVADRKLVRVIQTHEFQTAADLVKLLPARLPQPFDTAQLAKRLDVPRWTAQKITYCLRHVAAIVQVGKQRNALLYSLA